METGRPGSRRRGATAGLVGLAALAGGCIPDSPLPDDFGVCEASEDPLPASPVDTPTYHRDLRPILDAACTGCHTAGGIGPFALDEYASVVAFAPLMLDAVRSGAMPPWPPSRCCTPLQHERELTPEQRAVLERWVEQGAPEGDPADAPPPPTPPGLSRVDLELEMPEPYTPSATIGSSDDQRCFLIDWPADPLGTGDAEVYVTGLDFEPGRRDLVHHAIVYAVPTDKLAEYQDRDNADDGPGWSCPGGVVSAAGGYLGGWVPGAGVHDFPDGLGRQVPANSHLLLSVHYELSAGAAPDQTKLRFKLDNSVTTPVDGLAVMNPAWLVGKTMKIPAGKDDVKYSYAYDPAVWFNKGQPLQVHNVSLHMHELGTSASLAVLHFDGSVDCLLHIEDWDFAWQGEYFLTEPVTVKTGDRLYVECHFDNTQANQPDGAAPQDQWWGDDKEMCIASVMISR
ncbi:hypothetical protein ENSA7_08350 [Enhygromyxa salina]|uniref:Copper type II ascorbate-dependent monooxygenase C-terminal domain-containing protein n=1 Tax=Enhygromyxa salina TaxID=215803 RepID=A0A2S9YWK3_9BACT|nr:hypothetical protein ENSA7_08350 [Enhygromyxa salina]